MADTLRFIKGLKPELKEKLIYRVYLNKKLSEKKTQDWEEAHKSIKSAPYCGHNQQTTKMFFYINLKHKTGIYICTQCERQGYTHYLYHDSFDESNYDKDFIRILPPRKLIEILRLPIRDTD